jgi:uncharacterized membrane protein YhaH (DUF805 family)
MMESQVSTQYASGFMLITMAFAFLVSLIFMAITLVVYCKIAAKMGYSWALGLLMLVPIANIVLLFYLAFVDWPIHNELRQLKQQYGGLPA